MAGDGLKPGAKAPGTFGKLTRSERARVILGVAAIILLFAAVFIGPGLLSGSGASFSLFVGGKPSWRQVGSYRVESADAQALRGIAVEWAAGDVLVRRGAVEVPTVIEEADVPEGASAPEPTLDASFSAGELRVGKRSQGWLHFGGSSRVVVELPQTMASDGIDSLTVRGGSGDASVSGISSDRLDVELSAGDLAIDDAVFGTGALKTKAGDLKASVRAKDSVTASSSAGDISLACKDALPGRIGIDAGAGDVELGVPDGSGFRLDLDQKAGELESDGFDLARDGSAYRGGDGACAIQARLSAGDLKLSQA